MRGNELANAFNCTVLIVFELIYACMRIEFGSDTGVYYMLLYGYKSRVNLQIHLIIQF